MSTIKVTNLQNASAASPAIVLASDSTATLNGLAYPTSGSLSGRNRIINGDMRIDQRNAGASVTISGANIYSVDRWAGWAQTTAKFSLQQNAGSVTLPAGFKNYLGATSLSAYAVASTDYHFIAQAIEGLNVSDLGWGAAGAQTVTLSFWVRSSLTGSHGGAIKNSAENRSYPFGFTISAANTWEYKTVTVAGDTSGTWLADTGKGIIVAFNLGAGSSRVGTAGTWSGSNLDAPTGSVSVVGTNGATFYITGVQLEAGSVATPFERRSYGQELALCQRYYQQIGKTSSSNDVFAVGYTSTSNFYGGGFLKVSMRAAPTFSYTGTLSDLNYTHVAVSAAVSSIVASQTNPESYVVQLSSATGTTNGYGAYARCVTANVAVTFSAEL